MLQRRARAAARHPQPPRACSTISPGLGHLALRDRGSSSKGVTPVGDHRGLRLSRNAATRTVSARLVWSARPTGPPPPQSRLERWAKVSREIRPVKCPVNERSTQDLCTGQISAVSDLLIGCACLDRTARTTLTARREQVVAPRGRCERIYVDHGLARRQPRHTRVPPRRSPPAPPATCLSRGWTDLLADRRARHRRRPSAAPGRGFDSKRARSDAKRVGTLPFGGIAAGSARRRWGEVGWSCARVRGRSGMRPRPRRTPDSFSYDGRLGRRVASITHRGLN